MAVIITKHVLEFVTTFMTLTERRRSLLLTRFTAAKVVQAASGSQGCRGNTATRRENHHYVSEYRGRDKKCGGTGVGEVGWRMS